MSTGHLSVQCSELLHRGAWDSGVCTGICTWAVQHLGVGKGVLSMGVCAEGYTGIQYRSLT